MAVTDSVGELLCFYGKGIEAPVMAGETSSLRFEHKDAGPRCRRARIRVSNECLSMKRLHHLCAGDG